MFFDKCLLKTPVFIIHKFNFTIYTQNREFKFRQKLFPGKFLPFKVFFYFFKFQEIGFVQTRLSISPGWGGATRLGSIVGKKAATELLTSGRIMNAEQAVQMKLVDDIFDQNKV